MSQKIFIPTTFAPKNSRVIFLAGPIQGAPDWQTEAINYLVPRLKGSVIASPRRVVAPKDFVYEDQVDWETYHLNLAGANGVIIFWLAKESVQIPGRSYAQTTRYEISKWVARHQFLKSKIAIGIETGFVGERYLRKVIPEDCPDITIQNTMIETCDKALELL